MVGALPQSTIPPQSPYERAPAGWLDVNTIGAVAVPFAIIFAPLSITKVPFVFLSPLMITPLSMVNVAPEVTYTKPFNKYCLLLVQVVLVEILSCTVCTVTCACAE